MVTSSPSNQTSQDIKYGTINADAASANIAFPIDEINKDLYLLQTTNYETAEDISHAINQLSISSSKFDTSINKIDNSLNRLKASVLDGISKANEVAQTAKSNMSPLKSHADYLEEQTSLLTTTADEINSAIGELQMQKLQLKSYWLQSAVLLLIVIIFIYRLLVASYSDKPSLFDLILAIVSVLILLYVYWYDISRPAEKWWQKVRRNYISTPI